MTLILIMIDIICVDIQHNIIIYDYFKIISLKSFIYKQVCSYI